MANYLDANPDLKGMVQYHSDSGDMVPIAENGNFVCFTGRRVIDRHPIPTPLRARDFIVAMEVLGHRFMIHRFREDGPERLLLSRAIDREPPSWQARTNALLEAFGRGRAAEGIAFLRERDNRRAM